MVLVNIHCLCAFELLMCSNYSISSHFFGGLTHAEIRKLPLFNLVQIPDAKLKFWEEKYDNYRQEMCAALSSKTQSEMNPAEDVINKYKEVRISICYC